MTFEGSAPLQFAESIIDAAAIGTQAGLNLAKSYQSLELQKTNATSEIEIMKIILEQKKLEKQALKLLNERAGVSGKKGKKIAQITSIAGIAGVTGLLLFAQ